MCTVGMVSARSTLLFSFTLLALLLPLLLPHLATSASIKQVHINQGANGFFSKSAVIGIMSSVSNFRRRQMVRNTYMQLMQVHLRLKLYFIIGLDDVSPAHATAMEEENTHYGDLALLNGRADAPDAPWLSHWKVLGFFQFVLSLPHHYDYIVKADHDTYIHPINLQRLLSTLPDTRAYWGSPLECTYWFKACAQCKDFSNNRFTSQYHIGGFYLISRDLVAWIAANHGPMRLVTDTMVGHNGHQWEDLISGLWVAIAMSNLAQGIDDLEKVGIRGEDVMRGLEPLTVAGNNILEAGNIKWWNMDWWFWQGLGWNEIADLDAPRQEGAQLMPQPAAVAIHHAIKEQEFLVLHHYFVRSCYYQWTVCAHVDFGPTPCTQLLNDQPTTRSRLNFFLNFYTVSD